MQSTKELLTHKKSYDHKRLTKVNLHKNHMTLREADNRVEKLLERYGNSTYLPLYRKAVWYLSEADIINFMEKASAAAYPANYFVRCARNALLNKRIEAGNAESS